MAPIWQYVCLSGRLNLYSGLLLPLSSIAQEKCWTHGCRPSGNSHGSLIICERKEPWSRIVCIWVVLVLLFLFFLSLQPSLLRTWSDTVTWMGMWPEWNCRGRWSWCTSGDRNSWHASCLLTCTWHDYVRFKDLYDQNIQYLCSGFYKAQRFRNGLSCLNWSPFH